MISSFLTTVKMSVLVFLVVTSYGVVGKYKRFGGIYRPHLQGTVFFDAQTDFFLKKI